MIQSIGSSLTLSSGSWSWKTGERPVILPLRFVYVCCGVLSPGAEISQYSAILLASLRNKSTELKLTWMFFHTISSKTLPAPIYHYFSNLSAWQSRARTLVPPIAGDLSIILEWLLTESIDDSKLPLYGQGDFRFMRKVKVYYSSMAAKGLSHFFQKDKVIKIAHRFVCFVQLESTSNWLRFRMISVFVLLVIVQLYNIY